MKLFQARYRGKKYGRLHTEGQKAVINACFLNIEWEAVE